MKAVATTALVIAMGLTGCSEKAQDAAQEAPQGPGTATPAPTPTRAQTAATAGAVAEQAYVLEVVGKAPAMALARDELVRAGHATCEAFRTKPGGISVLMRNAKKAGQTEAQLRDLRVITEAAIHNLCPDQAGDLTR